MICDACWSILSGFDRNGENQRMDAVQTVDGEDWSKNW